jgi:hypothetical protein
MLMCQSTVFASPNPQLHDSGPPACGFGVDGFTVTLINRTIETRAPSPRSTADVWICLSCFRCAAERLVPNPVGKCKTLSRCACKSVKIDQRINLAGEGGRTMFLAMFNRGSILCVGSLVQPCGGHAASDCGGHGRIASGRTAMLGPKVCQLPSATSAD